MEKLTDNEIFEFNKRGLVPGPEESDAEFLERARYCLSLKAELQENLSKTVPFAMEHLASSKEILVPPLTRAQEWFDISPDWIPVYFSDYKLSPWHGGCAWIFQQTETSPLGALLQLRQAFRDRTSYLKIYHRDELIEHEMAHVGRMAFNEPQFEEFFSYSTSKSKFRRWFGPIIQSSKESLFFVMTLLLAFIADISLVSTGRYEFYSAVLWIKMIPVVLVLFALGRLWRRHYQFTKCYEKFVTVLGNPHDARAVLYRLTDKEIKAFSRLPGDAIKEYATKQKAASLRWKVISHYFSQGLAGLSGQSGQSG